eukprot:m51a1_g5063 hypothetical protein (512) ;mRNA; r:116811-118889
MGWGSSVVMNSKDNSPVPVFFFRSGRLREFVAELERRARLSASEEDPSVLRVNDTESQLAKSMIVTLPPPPAPADARAEVTALEHRGNGSSSPSSSSPSTGSVRDLPADLADLQWFVFEGFGKVTRFVSDRVSGFLPPPQQRRPASAERPADSAATTTVVRTSVGAFELVGESARQRIARTGLCAELPLGKREAPLDAEEWIKLLGDDGSISPKSANEFRRRAFYGGVSESIRAECWKYLLGIKAYSHTFEEREAALQKKIKQYQDIRLQWTTITKEQEEYCHKFKLRREQIAKDVVRTDREYPFFAREENLGKLNDILMSYTMFNWDLGYVQGMNDLCAVILNVMDGDEALTFWGFKNLMDSMIPMFSKDMGGMNALLSTLGRIVETMDPELYRYLESVNCTSFVFCFRWMLVLFKRELSFDTTKRLWEALLSNWLCPNFHLFVATAILIRSRDHIMQRGLQFDDILQYVNELSGHILLEPMLVEAEYIFLGFLRIADAQLKDLILSKPS